MHIALLAVDPALGRLDYDSLSDQTLMEMLIDGMIEWQMKHFQDKNGNFLDAGEWHFVTITDGRVTAITASYHQFSTKQFPFWFIPPHVKKFRLDQCQLHGTLDPSLLPRELRVFNVSTNALHGTISFKGAPQSLQEMCIFGNAFSGSLAVEDLPQTMRDFNAGKNQFSGEISLNDLPPALERLQLTNNALTGSINIERPPEYLSRLHLRNNSFSGDFRMSEVPHSLDVVDVKSNPLSGKIILGKATGERPFRLLIDDLASVVDENGDEHEWHDDIMRLSSGGI